MMDRLIVDIHAHILPGIHDGAKDWEESMHMIDIAISMGIRTIIATPHYSRHLDTGTIRKLAQKLEAEIQKRCPEFKIYPGQEILYFESIVEVLKDGGALTLADSRYILVEFILEVSYQKLYQGICKILRGGVLSGGGACGTVWISAAGGKDERIVGNRLFLPDELLWSDGAPVQSECTVVPQAGIK